MELIALRIIQPLGEFYITKFVAEDLLKVSFSEELTYVDDDGKLKGSQRKKDDKRLREIAKYIDSVEMAFPNSIILAANYNKNGELVSDETLVWRLEQIDDYIFKIKIPTYEPLAAVIDGQHRLKAFDYVENSDRKNLEIPCSIFFDLPNSYQAFLFATINGNQKKVDRSLALEQFGFNVDEEPQTSWTPEKLAVYFSRKLNLSKDISPFHHRIKVAPRGEEILFQNATEKDWFVSTSTIVDGILMLISSNPKRDRVDMAMEQIFKGRSRDMVKGRKDNSPLRQLFLQNRDEEIYDLIVSFFRVVDTLLWSNAPKKSYIFKTIGVLALFDLLKRILQEGIHNISFESYINSVVYVDFSDNYFQASGVGRSRVRNLLLYANNMYSGNKPEEIVEMDRLLGR